MVSDVNFVDLQVNGYGGVDFNQDDLDSEGLHTACAKLRDDGVGTILATLVTEKLDSMVIRLSNLVALREQDPLATELIKGIHIEGPFINPEEGYVGAHPPDAVRPASVDAMQRLLDAAGGMTRIVTLAPEQDDGLAVTRMLADQGIIVSAGHCNPSLEQLEAAIDAGLSMFTHLGNGCLMEMHRHDNVIQRVLSLSDRLWTCFIADGTHVPFFTLRNYLKITGLDRTIVVTDAIAPAGLGPGRYTTSRWNLVIGDDMVARAPDGSHFVGSAISMPQVYRNLIDHVGLSENEAVQLTSTNPWQAIGLPG
jgi:N-acetylglucosamine-6-phosphate deacetylase